MVQRVFLLFCVLIFCCSTSLAQRTHRIRVPQEKSTIQSAVSAARIGDTVLVDHGIYYENLRINKNIVLASRFVLDRDTAHISRTIIDGSKASDRNRASTIFIVGDTDTNCVISGLTIRGGRGNVRVDPNTPSSYWRYGGGIDVASQGATVTFNIITGNELRGDGVVDTVNGGGVFFGSDIRFRGQCYFILHGNTITDNHLDARCCQGGGVFAYYDGRITNNVITRNTHSAPKYNNGGGICLSVDGQVRTNPTIEVHGNQILQNSSPHGGGIFIYGFRVAYPVVLITNNIIAENNAFLAEGGGVDIHNGPVVFLSHNTIVNNKAGDYGGGIDASGSEVILMNNIIWNNTHKSRFRAPNVLYATNNILEGAVEGSGNIEVDPEFIPDDRLYRLAPGSPALGAGIPSIVAFGKRYRSPESDFLGLSRIRPQGSSPDLGAVESEETARPKMFKTQTRLTVFIMSREASPMEGKSNFKFDLRYVVNDSMDVAVEHARSAIEVSPAANDLIVDFIRRSDFRTRALAYDYFLEGMEKGSSFLRFSTTEYFRDLEAGTYGLTIGVALPPPPPGMIERIDYHTIDITVGMPWYKSQLAIVGYAVLGLLILLGVVIARVRKFRMEKTSRERFLRMQIESQESERKRLAAELHDGLGQNLLLASNELQQFLQQHDGAREEVQQAAHLLRESIHGVREMASNLHPHQLERLGFSAALTAMVETISHATGVEVSQRCADIDRLLPKEAEVQLYRIVQEALSNVVHHACAGQANVEISKCEAGLDVVIKDDGKGFDASEVKDQSRSQSGDGNVRGFGLSSMAERARIMGGELKVESSPGHGTSVKVTLPLRKKRLWNK